MQNLEREERNMQKLNTKGKKKGPDKKSRGEKAENSIEYMYGHTHNACKAVASTAG